jgi:DNA processing protein
MALAHLPLWPMEKKNGLLLDILDKRNMSLSEFFDLSPTDWQQEFGLSDQAIEDVKTAKAGLPEYASLATKLLQYDLELIPYTSEQYPPTLTRNLQVQYVPLLLYTMGNSRLFHEPTVAIVGSQKPSAIALEFTKNIAQTSVQNFEVVVTGFDKGVERTALEETLKIGGQSILVLSQGMLTFSSGFKRYYEQITAGDLLVCSFEHPKARQSKEASLERNRCLLGLAEKIYVAEVEPAGSLWGSLNAELQYGRTIYVRKPGKDEKNANRLLIAKGAKPV